MEMTYVKTFEDFNCESSAQPLNEGFIDEGIKIIKALMLFVTRKEISTKIFRVRYGM